MGESLLRIALHRQPKLLLRRNGRRSVAPPATPLVTFPA
jgi:hypothetical protein